MTPLSIGKAWEETVAFVKREGHLLFPVAFLFLALPMAIWPHMLPAGWADFKPTTAQPFPPVPMSATLGLMAAMLMTTLGSLALFSLALRPGISVGEALHMGVARLPVLIGAAFLIVGAFMLVVLATVLIAGLAAAVSKAIAALIAILVSMAVLAALVYASVRLTLLNPVVLDRRLGPIASIRAAWALSQGQFWRLLGFLAVILLVTTIASGAAQAVFGTLGGLAGSANGAVLVGGLASALVSAAANVYIVVMLSRIYRQLTPSGLDDVFR